MSTDNFERDVMQAEIEQAVAEGRLPRNPEDLLTPEEHAALNEHLANIARTRRRAEAESRNIVIAEHRGEQR